MLELDLAAVAEGECSESAGSVSRGDCAVGLSAVERGLRGELGRGALFTEGCIENVHRVL